MLKLDADSVFLQSSTPPPPLTPLTIVFESSPITTIIETDAAAAEGIKDGKLNPVSHDEVQDYFDLKQGEPFKVDLGGNVYLTHSVWKGMEKAHLRVYISNRPTKTGITFNAVRYANLLFQSDAISFALDRVRRGMDVDFKINIGGNVFATVQSPAGLVNIFKYYIPKNASTPVPSRYGIVLGENNWSNFLTHMHTVKLASASFKDAIPCWLSLDHQNQMCALECRECHFFDNC